MYDVYGVGNALVGSEYWSLTIWRNPHFQRAVCHSLTKPVNGLLDLIEQRHGIQKALASGGSAAIPLPPFLDLG